MLRGVPISPKTLNVDEIMSVGPGGHFLDTDYTLKNMRELWNPGICHSWLPDKGSFSDAREAAKQKLKRILANHAVQPLDASCKKEFSRILKNAAQAAFNR
jgi:trimethylamine:corrinoid methyltransferase-like protein